MTVLYIQPFTIPNGPAMKFTLSWLKDHLDTDADVGQIAEKLTALGHEVERIEQPGAGLKPFIVGEITRAEPHPNADRLRVCDVNTGNGHLTIVCGAPNARAGIKVVVSRPGDVIPSTGQALKAGIIRGVESQGMLCSAAELGLSGDADGILELPPGAQPGQPVSEVLNSGDPVVELSLTPNRADCASVHGIARDLAAGGMGSFKPLRRTVVPGIFDSPIGVTIAEDTRGDCPLFVGRTIRGVSNRPSPGWLQDRLRAIGLRPLSALVDITNYFTFDLGRPLHVFDVARMQGSLVVRHGHDGESLEALNGKTYQIKPSHVVIADGGGPVSLAGIVGGEASGCTEDTTSVFLEVALFRPGAVAAMGRELQIQSDARYRFERGLDPALVFDAAELATKMIVDLCGGEASEVVVAGSQPHWRRELTLREDRVKTLGGVELAGERQLQLLEHAGFRFEGTTIIPPSWRGDVHGEADLVEELLRLESYDKIPATPLPRMNATTRSALTPLQKRPMQAKRLLASRGLHEAVTFSFVSSATLARFEPQAESLTLLNPISTDLNAMRTSILPNLIDAVARNAARGVKDCGLFEVGPVYRESGQQTIAGLVRAGDAVPRGWAGQARAAGVFDVKSDTMTLLAHLGAPASLSVEAGAPAWYHPGRSGTVKMGHKPLAYFGELHPNVLKAHGSSHPVAAAEIFLDALPEPKQKRSARPLLALSPYQAVERDFAFVVASDVRADALLKAVRAADKALIQSAEIFDVYTGKGIEEGQKSVAVSITLQPADRTLTDAEIDEVGKAVVKSVSEATGAKLRG